MSGTVDESVEIRCSECGGSLRSLKNQEYHYKECGLENVRLQGITVVQCTACGAKAPRIPYIRDLHSTIALAVVSQPNRLGGSEIRFLRKQLGMQAKDLARQLGYTASEFSRFENNKTQIGEQGDRLIRMYYLTKQAKKLGYSTLDELVKDALIRFGDPSQSHPIDVDINNLIIHERNTAPESSTIQ